MADAPPPFLPYGRQSINDDDIAAVTAVLRGDWLTQGPTVAAFEDALAQKLRAAPHMTPHVTACATGTAALHIASLALDFAPGDAAIIPAVTFLATANAPHLAGAAVVFADVDPDNGLMRPADADAAIGRARRAGLRPRALYPVHYAGQAVDMAGLGEMARTYDLMIVEDACHALGGMIRDPGGRLSPVGSGRDSAFATFSFHPVKAVAAGEGGAVVTTDPQLAERVRALRNHGMIRHPAPLQSPENAYDADGAPNPWYYEMIAPGFNYRLTDIQSALGRSQLRRLEYFIGRRRALMKRYARRLAPLAPAVKLMTAAPGCRAAWHLCVALIDFAGLGRSRAAVMADLRAQGIGSQVHYIPLHLQPFWRQRCDGLRLPGAEAFYARALSLPLFPDMADGDVDRVAGALGKALMKATP